MKAIDIECPSREGEEVKDNTTQDMIDDLNNVPLTCTLEFTRTWRMTVVAANQSHAEAILKKLVDEQNQHSPPEPETVGAIVTIKPEFR